MDSRPSLQSALDAFGVPAVVTRPAPNDTPVPTSVIWLSPRDAQPAGSDFGRRDPRRIMAIPRSIGTVERNTVVAAAEYRGGETKTWLVTGFDEAVEPDCVRALVKETSS